MLNTEKKNMKYIKIPNTKYEITEYGDVRRVFKNGAIHYITPRKNKEGYLIIKINKKNRYIHQLVCRAFLENINNYPVIDHIDRNKQNNHFMNLRYTTNKGNAINTDKYENRKGYICKTKDTQIYKNKTKTYEGWRAYYHIKGVAYSKRNKDYNVCREWLDNMILKNKNEIYICN